MDPEGSSRPQSTAPTWHSARNEGMTNHSTGDSVPAVGAVPFSFAPQSDLQVDHRPLERMLGAGGRELVRGSRGQSPLGAREASPGLRSEATQPSSLDEIQTNRNRNPDPAGLPVIVGRGRYCGAWTVAGLSPDGDRVIFHRVNCKTWSCSFCGPRKAKRYKRAIRMLAEQEQLNRFLTLTLNPSRVQGEPVRYLRQVFNKFRTYLRRKYGVSIKYIAVLEFHKNGAPHLHLLVDRFIPQGWISQSWSALGGGQIVHIKFVDVHRISRGGYPLDSPDPNT